MEFIPTTATTAEKLKRKAKTLRKTTGTSLAAALDTVAKQHGYSHWKHVTSCCEKTPNRKTLPTLLADFLERAAKERPASQETQKAFKQGFVFALDVKDGLEVHLPSDYVECEDGIHLAAKDLWVGLIHNRDEEIGTTLFETETPEELLTSVLDDIPNYMFFRYCGSNIPASLEKAYTRIKEFSFFAPTHVWLGGKFIDMSEVPEIRVDGKVVFFTTQPSTDLSAIPKQSRPDQPSLNLTFAVHKIQSGLYQVATLSGGVEVTDPSSGYSSIEEAIREGASLVPSEFALFGEVVYGGASSGTMAISAISQKSSQIADQLVAVVAEMHGHR